MRALPSPWLSSHSPDLDSHTSSPIPDPPSLTPEELEEMSRHMSESYTKFDLPLASDPMLFERYVNTTGGFRKYPSFNGDID